MGLRSGSPVTARRSGDDGADGQASPTDSAHGAPALRTWQRGRDRGGIRRGLPRAPRGCGRRGKARDADEGAGGRAARRGVAHGRPRRRPARVGRGGRRRRARARAEQLDRASEDLVGRRPGPLLGRSGADRRALRARLRAAEAPPGRRREGGGQRPAATGEPARSRAGQADRGVHADPHTVGNPGALRDLPARRVGHGERAAAAEGTRTADPRRGRVDPARAGPAPLVVDARAAAWERAARGTARECDGCIGAGTAQGRFVSPRRAGAGDRRHRVLARTARGRGRVARSERAGRCAPPGDRASP